MQTGHCGPVASAGSERLHKPYQGTQAQVHLHSSFLLKHRKVAGDGLKTQVPAIPMSRKDGAPGSWLLSGPALAADRFPLCVTISNK